MNGLYGQLAVQLVDQVGNLEPFKSKHKTRARYVLDYHRGTVTPSPAQVRTFQDIFGPYFTNCIFHSFSKILGKINCQWSSWSQCSKSCGTGTQYRTIYVQEQYGGQVCAGLSQKNCYTQSCPSKYIFPDFS